MRSLSNYSLLYAVFLIFLAFPHDALGQYESPDALHLNNGRIVHGYITEVVPGESVTMRLENGRTFRYLIGEISRITKAPAQSVQSSSGSAEPRGSRFMVAIQGGLVRANDAGIFMDLPVNKWMDRDGNSPVVSAQAYYQVSSGFQLGFYAEYEPMKWSDAQFPDTNGTFNRLGVGVAYLGRFPDGYRRVGLEVGGRLGLSYLPPGDLDSQAGVEYGAFVGPVVQLTNRFQLGLHVGGFYQGYRGGRVPSSIRSAQLRAQTVVYFAL